MTLEEAIRVLEGYRLTISTFIYEGRDCGEHEAYQAYGTVIEASQKQMPKNVTVKSLMYHHDSYYCPCCNKQQKDTRKNRLDGCYCERCGNKLVWGKK